MLRGGEEPQVRTLDLSRHDIELTEGGQRRVPCLLDFRRPVAACDEQRAVHRACGLDQGRARPSDDRSGRAVIACVDPALVRHLGGRIEGELGGMDRNPATAAYAAGVVATGGENGAGALETLGEKTHGAAGAGTASRRAPAVGTTDVDRAVETQGARRFDDHDATTIAARHLVGGRALGAARAVHGRHVDAVEGLAWSHRGVAEPGHTVPAVGGAVAYGGLRAARRSPGRTAVLAVIALLAAIDLGAFFDRHLGRLQREGPQPPRPEHRAALDGHGTGDLGSIQPRHGTALLAQAGGLQRRSVGSGEGRAMEQRQLPCAHRLRQGEVAGGQRHGAALRELLVADQQLTFRHREDQRHRCDVAGEVPGFE